MKVRFYGHGWTCECNSALRFLDGIDVPRRRMTCTNPNCDHIGIAVFEPVLEAEPVVQVAQPKQYIDWTCPWCNTNAKEAMLRNEGPHATWCRVYYGQRPVDNTISGVTAPQSINRAE